MSRVRFITTEYLFKYTILDSNIDADLLTPYIDQASDINIQQTIGNSLYTKLKNDVIAGGSTGYYATLMKDYIKPALAQWVLYYAMPFINYKMTNKSIAKKTSDNSTTAEQSEIVWLRDQVRDTAEFLTRRITEYIMTNTGQFPEYFTTSGPYQLKPKKDSYFGGIYLGKSLNRGKGYGDYKPGYGDSDCYNCGDGTSNY